VCVSIYFATDFVLFLFHLLQVFIKFMYILVSSFLLFTFQGKINLKGILHLFNMLILFAFNF